MMSFLFFFLVLLLLPQVHFNIKYDNLTEANKRADGILVLAVLFRSQEENLQILKPVTELFPFVKEKGSTVPFKRSLILSHLLPKFSETFYKYLGSLTTPPCSQSVTWIIFPDLMAVASDQLEKFQSLDRSRSKSQGGSSVRNLQKLNGRKVYVSRDEWCNRK